MLNRRLFQALVEICGKDGRYPTLVENLGQRNIAPGRWNVRRVDELFKKLPAITLHAEELVDRVGIKVGR